MKTAISLPDELFRQADELATRLGIPRSRLYARALAEYLEAHAPGQITSALDAVYADVDSAIDPDVAIAQEAALDEDQW